MKKSLLIVFFIASFFLLSPHLYAQSPQVVSNGEMTAPVNFTGSCTYTWTNDNPSIGLPASGTGPVPTFTAVNTGSSQAIAHITATPILPSNFAYIANSGSNDVSVIDLSSNTVITKINVGENPYGVAVSPDGNFVYVTNATSGSVSAISTTTNKVITTVDVQSDPLGICVSPDGKLLYVGNDGSNTISVISTATYKVINTFSAISRPYGLAINPDGSQLFVAAEQSSSVLVFNTANDAPIATIPVGYTPWGIVASADGKYVYVANASSADITVIDAKADKVITNIQSLLFFDADLTGLAISPDGGTLYVSDQYTNLISVINTETNTVTKQISLPAGSIAIGVSLNADGSELYVSCEGSNTVSVISTSSNTITKTIKVDSEPYSFGNFVKTGTGCAPVSFTIIVNHAPQPTITTTPPTGTIIACEGSASASPNIQQFSFSGTNLTGPVTLTAPTGFSISDTESGPWSAVYIIPQTSGTITGNHMYVRAEANAPVGIITNQNVTLTSPGANAQTVSLSGTINALPTVNQPGNQTVANGTATTAVSFTGIGNVFNWTNDTPGIGLAASGTGNIPSFSAVNTGSSKVTATITVTPSTTSLAYIENNGNNSISVINTATQKVINTISLTTPENSSLDPNSIAVSPDGQRVYIGEQASNDIIVYNTTTNSSVNIPSIVAPISICVSPDNTRFYVASDNSPGSVYVFNAGNNTQVSVITIGGSPGGMIISPDGSKLYVAVPGGSSIDVINTSTDKIINSIPCSSLPNWLAISPDGNTLYATSLGMNTLSIINTVTAKVITSIPTGSGPTTLAISPDGGSVFVVNQLSNNVTVINTATNKVVAAIEVGDNPSGISITNDGSELYVTNSGSGTVSVINTTNDMVTATIPVGETPLSRGNFISPGGYPGAPVSFTITVDPAVGSIITTTPITGTISACLGTPSADPNIQQFNASGTNLTGDITVTAPTGFEVSREIDGPYSSNPLTLTQTLGSVGSSLIYVRSGATAPAGIITNENVTLSSPGAADQSVALNGIIYTIPAANTPPMQRVVNGTLTTPVNFTGTASSYAWVNNTTSIGLAANGTGNIPSFTAVNNTGSPVIALITVTPLNGLDCAGQSQEFTITVDPSPTILTVTGTLTALTTVYGTPSPSESFTVSCTTIGSKILVTPPAGFEVSSDGIAFSNSATITTEVSNSSIPVYIRLASSTQVGNNYGGNVIISTTNANSQKITIPLSSVTPAPLTITADNKTRPYGAANPVLTVSYNGFVNNDGPAQLTAQPAISTIATISSVAGQYPIIADDAASPDYMFNYVPGILTITPFLSLQDIPNTFTPNGDGRNDTWVIKALEYYPQSTVNIFNRWGQKLYSSVGYPIPWDGEYNGKALPSGTYYYIIDLKNRQPVIAGWVAIIR